MLLLIQILSYFCYFERERGGGNLTQQATPEQKPPTFYEIRAILPKPKSCDRGERGDTQCMRRAPLFFYNLFVINTMKHTVNDKLVLQVQSG